MRKTKVFGLSMETRSARRRLVIVIYTILALSLFGCWFLDRFHISALYLYLIVIFFLNQRVLGGYGVSGLVKPFTGKGPKNPPMPSNLIDLQLSLTGALPRPEPDEYRNDERETARRDHVHYQAYQGIAILLIVVWFLANWQLHPPRFVPVALLPILLNWIALPAILLALTLPQAILLWTEPDMTPEPQV